MPHLEQPRIACKNTIFKYFPLETELDHLRREKQLGNSDIDLSHYLRNSVLSTLGEFAGHVKDDTITYQLNNGHIYYPNVAEAIDDNLERQACDKGPESREWADWQGMVKIRDAFAQNKANLAFWVSPPSFGVEGFGTYGFVFVLRKKPDGLIEENILRYENEDRNFSQSMEFFTDIIPDSLGKKGQEDIVLRDEKSFLSHPLLLNADDSIRYVDGKLQHWGFPQTGDALRFRETVTSDGDINNWLAEFNTLMLFLADMEKPDLFLLSEAKKKFTAIYNRACVLNKYLGPPTAGSALPADHILFGGDAVISDFCFASAVDRYAYYSKAEPVVEGGGSCPGSRQESGSGKGFGFDMLDSLVRSSGGILGRGDAAKISESRGEKLVICPGCNKEVTFQAEKVIAAGRLQCPNCQLAVEDQCNVEAIVAAARSK